MSWSESEARMNPRIAAALDRDAAKRLAIAGNVAAGLVARLSDEMPKPPKAQRTGGHASKLEALRAQYHDLRKRECHIAGVITQPRFYLPGGVRYTADFLVIGWEEFGGGHLLTVEEVKGHRLSKNARDGITRFRIASGIFKWATWKLVEWRDGGWVETVEE